MQIEPMSVDDTVNWLIDGARHPEGVATLSFGLALDFGQIHYGNIGAADRLDFTAIGPAVNLAARMEAIAAENGHDIVVSSEIQADLKIETESLGHFSVKGFAERIAILAVSDNLSTNRRE